VRRRDHHRHVPSDRAPGHEPITAVLGRSGTCDVLGRSLPPARFARLYRTVAEHSYFHELIVDAHIPDGLLAEVASLSGVPIGRIPAVPVFDVAAHPAVAQSLAGGHNAVVKSALTLSHLLNGSPHEAVWPTVESVHAVDDHDWDKWLKAKLSLTRFTAPILMSFADGQFSAGTVEPVLSSADMASFVRRAWDFGVLDELLQGRRSAAAEQLFLPSDLRIEAPVEKFIDRYVSGSRPLRW
jgi:hypothetical protein